MGFTDLLTDVGLKSLNSWLSTRSYIVGYGPSQADVTCFKSVKDSPQPAKYPHAYRWFKHIGSHSNEFGSLPGDPSKAYTTYGPEAGAEPTPAASVTKAPNAADEEEEEDDLFGSDSEEEDPEVVKRREENLAAYREKKAAKPKAAAKSIVTMDVKPWDDETNMDELEKGVRAITMDGLVWGAGKRVPVGYGIHKLQVNLVVEDEKVSLEDLQGQIEGDEEHVQSTDIVAMQKL